MSCSGRTIKVNFKASGGGDEDSGKMDCFGAGIRFDGGHRICRPAPLYPSVSVTEEYNDNIDLDRKNKKDDFITTVTVGGTLELLGR